MANELIPTTPVDNSFSQDFNPSGVSTRYDPISSVIGTLAGGAVASVVDFGASLWNALPGTTEVDTGDLLKKVSNNALEVYNQHPDAVHAASFIGGIFVPAGIAMKGMNLARAGAKGASWFSEAGKVADTAKVAELFKTAGAESTAYKTAIRNLYARGAANNALDAVAAEAAIVFSMNAHPLMEDYMQDMSKNFIYGSLTGAALGGGIGLIADRFIIKGLVGAAKTEMDDLVRKNTRFVSEDMTNVLAFQAENQTVQNMQSLLDKNVLKGFNESNSAQMRLVATAKVEAELRMQNMFDQIASGEMANLSKEERLMHMNRLAEMPEMYGVEKVSFLSSKEATAIMPLSMKGTGTTARPNLTYQAGIDDDGNAIIKSQKIIYYPDIDQYAVMGSQIHYGNASALFATPEEAMKALPKGSYKVPNHDNAFDLLGQGASEIQGRAIGLMKQFSPENMNLKEFDKVVISNSDLASLDAVHARMLIDPELAGKTVKIDDKEAYYKAIQDAKAAGPSTSTTTTTTTTTTSPTGKVAVSNPVVSNNAAALKSQAAEVENIVNTNHMADHNGVNFLASAVADPVAQSAVTAWRSGDQALLQRGAVGYFARGYSKAISAAEKAAKEIFKNFYESEASVLLRDKLRQVADSDGFIYLYRGTSTSKLRGQAPLESMTQNFEKAKQFAKGSDATINLYKVHVDDVAGTFKDVGGGIDNTEFIVAATARPAQVSMDGVGRVKFAAQQAATNTIQTPGSTVTQTVINTTVQAPPKFITGVAGKTADEVAELIIQNRAEAIDSMIANSIPSASIAIKTNTPIGIVEAYAASAIEGSDGLKAVLAATTHNKVNKVTGAAISTLDQAAEALSSAHKPMILQGNMRKNPYIEAHANLSNKMMSNLNSVFTMSVLAGAKSQTAREWGDFMQETAVQMEYLGKSLSRANNEVAGSGFGSSLDQVTRKMGEVGPIISSINKKVTSMMQEAIGRVAAPIREAMAPISKDPASIIEFSTYFNLNHSLTGWRKFDYETGRVMQKVPREIEVNGVKQMVEVLEAVKWGDKEYRVVTPIVKDLIAQMQKAAPELRELANTSKKIAGSRNVQDIGDWVPTMNPKDKHISYVHDKRDDSVSMIWSHTKEAQADKVAAYRKWILAQGGDFSKNVEVIDKGAQEAWSKMNGRMDSIQMKVADTSMLKGGSSASAIVGADLSIFGEIIGGYEHYISSAVRNMVDITMPEVTGMLDKMSAINKFQVSKQPLGMVQKWVQAPKDTAALMKNAILGVSNVGEYGGWKAANQTFETAVSMGMSAVTSVFDAAIKPLTGKAGLTTDAMKAVDYEKVAKDLDARGIVNPWAHFDKEAANMYGLNKLEDSPDISKRLVYAGSSLAATVILRMGDIAQPLVNMVSLPILTHLAAAQKMPESFLGVKLATTRGVSAPQIMYEGVRAMNSPKWQALGKKWEEAGYYHPMISEINKTVMMTRALDKGAIAATERMVDSDWVRLLAKPADYSEALVRKFTMFNGAVLAKRLYPELDDAGITLFARDFMDKAVGNFNAGQRPVMFQGTLGVALGLFQTYSLTLAQNVYRHLEMKNYKAIGQAAMLQTGVFGSGSLPGFNAVSQAIGANFSDDHTDLVTGSYRALGDTAASSLIYGLPSQLGLGISTRGDSNPRFPGTGNDSLAVINFAQQAAQSVQTMADAVGNRDKSIPAAFAEALSLQSLSRPLARGAELVTGYSVTQKGNTVQTPEEVWTFAGIAARLISTRPAEEIKLRDAIHLRSFYGAADSKNRSELMNEVKQRVRAGTLSESDISEASDAYFRKGGTPNGWRSAINSAMASENTDGKEIFVDKLKPTSSLHYMINNMDGYSD